MNADVNRERMIDYGAVGLLDDVEDDLDIDDCLDRLVAAAQQYDTKLQEFFVLVEAVA